MLSDNHVREFQHNRPAWIRYMGKIFLTQAKILNSPIHRARIEFLSQAEILDLEMSISSERMQLILGIKHDFSCINILWLQREMLRHEGEAAPGLHMCTNVLENQFAYSSTKTYVVGAQKNRLNETALLSTQNTCLNKWERK